jgi:hypothetical protein
MERTPKRLMIVIVLIAFISLVQAQDQLQLYSDRSSTNVSSCPYHKYLQYYSMPHGAVPSTLISEPVEISIGGIKQITFPLKSQQEKIMYSQQLANISNENGLWIEGMTDYSQYVAVPKGSTVSIIAISPKGGNGILTETGPDGAVHDFPFNFYPQSQLDFYAETIGKYILFTVIGDKVSNNVEIDVVANCTSRADALSVKLDSEQEETDLRSIDVKRFPIIGSTGQADIKDCHCH